MIEQPAWREATYSRPACVLDWVFATSSVGDPSQSSVQRDVAHGSGLTSQEDTLHCLLGLYLPVGRRSPVFFRVPLVSVSTSQKAQGSAPGCVSVLLTAQMTSAFSWPLCPLPQAPTLCGHPLSISPGCLGGPPLSMSLP